MSPINWLIDHKNDVRKLMDANKEDELQNHLRWFLAMRCWTWYFGEFVDKPNVVLFNRIERSVDTADDYLRSPNEELINHLNEKGLYSYVASYALLIACGRVQRKLNNAQEQLEQDLEQTENRRRDIQDDIEGLEEEIGKLDKQITDIKQTIREAEESARKAGANVEVAQVYQERIGELKSEKKSLTDQRNEERQTLRDLEEQKENVRDEEEDLRKVLETLPEYGSDTFSIQSGEHLEEILRLGLAEISARRKEEFDPETYIAQLRSAQDYESTVEGIRKLQDLIG